MNRNEKIVSFLAEIRKQGSEFYAIEYLKAAKKYFGVTEATAKKYIDDAIEQGLLRPNQLKLTINIGGDKI
jgi:hypothetical protein